MRDIPLDFLEEFGVPQIPTMSDNDDVPYAEVEQTGRFSWKISIHHGYLRWGPDGLWFTHFGTENGASRKAERLLDKYEKTLEKREEQDASRFRVY